MTPHLNLLLIWITVDMGLPLPPGVYFERADAPIWSVDQARSDIAGFVGVAERGPLFEPVRVQSWTQYSTRFGRGQLDYAYLPDAVRGFFSNGGQTAWIVRVGFPIDPGNHAGLYLVDEQKQSVFRVRAKDPGLGGNAIQVRVLAAVRDRFHLAVDVLNDSGKWENLEFWRDLESDKFASSKDPNVPHPENDRYIAKVVNGWYDVQPPSERKPDSSVTRGSVLVVVEELSCDLVGPIVGVREFTSGSKVTQSTNSTAVIPRSGRLGWNADEVPPERRSVLSRMTIDHFVKDGLAALETINDVAVLAMPDLVWRDTPKAPYVPLRRPCSPGFDLASPPPAERRLPFDPKDIVPAQQSILAHCANLRNRFAILDPPADLDPVSVQRWATKLHSSAGQFGAIYYPWIGISTSQPGVLPMPPSGHLAGVYARVDLSAGVEKSPANEILSEVQGVMYDVTEEARGQLNAESINVLKAAGNRGVRVMGARTLANPQDPQLKQWRFVSVRRLLLMLESSLERSAFWLVMTDNRPQRWLDTERVIRSFLTDQWQKGRLDGASADNAFSVQCDATTNPQEEIDAGRMTCVIGVQPPLPAEFVFVRIGDRGGSGGNWSFGGNRNGAA